MVFGSFTTALLTEPLKLLLSVMTFAGYSDILLGPWVKKVGCNFKLFATTSQFANTLGATTILQKAITERYTTLFTGLL